MPNDHSRTIYFEIGNEMDNTPSLFSLTSCPSDPNTSPVPDAYLACYPDIFGQSAQDIEGNLNVLKTEPSWAWMKGYRILTGAMSVPTAALGPNANIDKAIAAITEAENAYGVSSSVLGTAVHPYGYATSLPQAWPHFSMVKYTKVVPVTIPVWGLSPEMANGQYVYDTITGQRLTIWDIVGETTIDFPAACRCTTWFRPQSIRNFIRLDTMLRLWTGDPADTSGDSAYAAGYTALTGLPLIFTEDNWNANYEPAGWDAMNLSPDWQLTAAYMVDVFTWLARNGEINPSRNIDIKNYADVATSPVRVLMFSGADSASSAGDWPRGLYTYAGSTKPIPPASQYTCHAQWVTDVATAFQLAAKAPCF